jgi:hypothetical protein
VIFGGQCGTRSRCSPSSSGSPVSRLLLHKYSLLTFIATFLPSENKYRRPANLQSNAVSDIGGEEFNRKDKYDFFIYFCNEFMFVTLRINVEGKYCSKKI